MRRTGSGLSLPEATPESLNMLARPTLQHAPFRRYMRLCQKAISAYCDAPMRRTGSGLSLPEATPR